MMNRSEDLQVLYSPSRWSRRYRAEEIIKKHIEFISNASKRAKSSIPCQLDIAYGSTPREKFDIFGTDLPKESPIFIYIHGGYWQMLERELSSYVVEPLYKNGFKVVVMGYNLCPNVTLATIMKEVHGGFLKCLEYATTNQSRGIYIGGHSAGAHLAISLLLSLSAQDQELIKGAFLISGVYDLIPLLSTDVNDALKLDIATARQLSPMSQQFMENRKMKVFVIVGESDTPAFKQQAELFHRRIHGQGIKSQFIMVKEVDHFDIVEQLNNENYEITRLIISMES